MIVTLVIVAAGLVNKIISTHYALKSARAVLRSNSESILGGINKLMMSRNNDGVLELIQDISKGSTIYRDVRLVSHYSGETVVSRLDSAPVKLSVEDRSCAMCHDQGDLSTTLGHSFDEVVAGPDGTRILRDATPIANEIGCRTANCHAHEGSGPVLGFLQADYSLGEIDAVISRLNAFLVIAALAAILLGTVTLWIMFRKTVAKPIRYLLTGMQSIAGNDLTFRFKTDRDDEIGLVEESFNHMTDKIRAHQTELRDAMEYFEGIVANSADIIITVNPEGLIQTVNRGAEQVLGYQKEELIGQRIELLFADPRERDVAISGLQDRDNVTNYETRFLTKNKEVRNVLLTLSRLRDRDGNPIGTFGISKDVTKEKELQKQLLLSEKAAAIGQAVTAIQHAIKNMLNTLTGGSYLVRHGVEKNTQDNVEDGLAMIEEGISRIKNLSSNMLKYAKEWKLELEETDLSLLATEVYNAIKQTASDRNLKLHLNLSDNLPSALCDPRLVHMTLMDVATNALDACALKHYDTENAEVVFNIYLEKDGESITVEVKDNGTGMTEEVKANVFTPFFSTKEEWGTGLGLAVTSRIINMHGGGIDVESEPEKGTTIRITLPVAGKSANRGAKDE
jgi:PAS domain S-box-containing protein